MFTVFSKSLQFAKGPRFGVRYVQTLLMFLLLSIGYAMRTNLSVGIVAMTSNTTSPNPDVPTYDWDNTSIVLSSFYIGYICLQVFAGELGKKYGPKWFLVGAMAVNSVGCMLTPLMAKEFGSYGVMAIRIIQGLFQGFFFPSVQNFLGKWAPEDERSTIGNFIYAGVAFGTIFAMPVTGLIAGTWAGWPVAFYVFGCIGFAWCLAWALLGSNSPAQHRTISKEERFYIETSLKDTEHKKVPDTPWKAILTSWPVWAIVVANSGQNWAYITVLTEISTYLSNVCGLDISKNSFLSAAPYLALFILGLIFGPMADWIIVKGYLSPRNTRRLMNSIGALFPAMTLTVLACLPADTSVALIETFLILSVGINGAIWCGFQVNHVDLSPKFSGVLMGIGNGAGNIFSILSPLAVQFIVTDKTDISQWRIVFLISSAVYVGSNIFYVIFARAERQWWDNVGDEPNDVSSSNTVPVADSPDKS